MSELITTRADRIQIGQMILLADGTYYVRAIRGNEHDLIQFSLVPLAFTHHDHRYGFLRSYWLEEVVTRVTEAIGCLIVEAEELV